MYLILIIVLIKIYRLGSVTYLNHFYSDELY